MLEKSLIYVHTGEWPTPSPSIVFVTGTAWGLAHCSATELIVRNAGGERTDDVFRSLTGRAKPDSLDIVRIGFGGKTPGHGAFFREAVKRIAHAAKGGTLRAVLTRSIGFLPYLLYIKKWFGAPVYFETHDFFSDASFRTDLRKTPQFYRNLLFERTLFPQLDGVICLTHSQKTLVRKYYPKIPIVVAPTGLFDITNPLGGREKKLCYVGSLDTHKGVGTVLAALAGTIDRTIGLLVIGGKNEEEIRRFKEAANRLGVGDRVEITGWVRHADVGALMDRCMAGIVPLNDTPFNRYITSPLKILDCFAHSLPVIGSDLPSIREYIEPEKHGLLFEPDNAGSCAEVINRFFREGIRDRMAATIHESAGQYLFTRRAEKINAFIDDTSGL